MRQLGLALLALTMRFESIALHIAISSVLIIVSALGLLGAYARGGTPAKLALGVGALVYSQARYAIALYAVPHIVSSDCDLGGQSRAEYVLQFDV